MTSKEPHPPEPEKARFSIGAKLLTITFAVLALSLGAVTALASWLVRGDLRNLALETNFEVNRRSSQEAARMLENMMANSQLLISSARQDQAASPLPEGAEFIFSQNPVMAAVVFAAAGRQEAAVSNPLFFETRRIREDLAGEFFESNRAALDRAALGETVLLNATPWFSYPMSALYFPLSGGEGAGVLFSPENLSAAFGFGPNQSFLINDMGDIIVHSDFELLQGGANASGGLFARHVWESGQLSGQTVLEGEGRFIAAFTKLAAGGSAVITAIEYDTVFDSAGQTVRRNIYLAAAVLSLSLLIVWFFAKRMSASIKELTQAANKIEGGSFKTELSERRRADELGVLISSFRRMSCALEKFNMAGKNKAEPESPKAESGDYAQNVFKVKLAERAGREKLALQQERTKQAEIALAAEINRQRQRALAAEAALEEELSKSREAQEAAQGAAQGAANKNKIASARGDFKIVGEVKLATVFFSSINEFAAKSEAYTKEFHDEAAQRVVRCLNNYFSHMVKCIEKTNGTVDKFIGDSLLAYWGTAPSGTPEKDAFNCITTALMMRKTLYKINSKRKPGVPPLRIGCGINTGPVTAGEIGFNSKKEYTILGDPVNLASKIKACAKPFGVDILIGEETWRLVKNYFLTEEMPPLQAGTGKKSKRLFAVVNFSGINKGPQTLAQVRELLGMESRVASEAAQEAAQVAAQEAAYEDALYAKAANG